MELFVFQLLEVLFWHKMWHKQVLSPWAVWSEWEVWCYFSFTSLSVSGTRLSQKWRWKLAIWHLSVFWGYNSKRLISKGSILSAAVWQHEGLQTWQCLGDSENSCFGWEQHLSSHLWVETAAMLLLKMVPTKGRKEHQPHRAQLSICAAGSGC